MSTMLFVTFAVIGGLCIVVSVPLILRRIGPNWVYGLKTTKTMQNPRIWYNANAYAGKCLLASGIAIAVFSTALYLFAPNLHPATFALVSTFFALAVLLVTVVQSLRYLSTLD